MLEIVCRTKKKPYRLRFHPHLLIEIAFCFLYVFVNENYWFCQLIFEINFLTNYIVIYFKKDVFLICIIWTTSKVKDNNI